MTPTYRVLALHESGGHHVAFSQRARLWLDALADECGFAVDYFQDTDTIDDALLSRYRLFFQMDYPPWGWRADAAAAFERYIGEGRGGWVGLHHAGLLGAFDGHPMWEWFSRFLGGIVYRNYIPTFARGTVHLEASEHSVLRGVPSEFVVEQEEWYVWDRSPRPAVQVLARVDEGSYDPASPVVMGDHPVVWSNPAVAARNLYCFMGHAPGLFDHPAYATLLRNALLWAAEMPAK